MCKCADNDLSIELQHVRKERDAAKEALNVLAMLIARQKHQGRFRIGIGQPQLKDRKENPMLELSITNEQKVTVTLAPVTSTGKPAALDGAAKWSVQSGESTVVPSEDGLSAELVSSDKPGDTVFLVEADADLGEGVETIADTIRLSVAGARAQNLGLTAGEPVAKEQPAA